MSGSKLVTNLKSLFQSLLLVEHYFLAVLFTISVVVFSHRKLFGFMVISFLLVYLCLLHERMTTHALIILSASLAFNIGGYPFIHKARVIAISLIVFTGMVFLTNSSRYDFVPELHLGQPKRVMDYMEANHLNGPLLTEWAFAAYVLFRRGDKNRVFYGWKSWPSLYDKPAHRILSKNTSAPIFKQ